MGILETLLGIGMLLFDSMSDSADRVIKREYSEAKRNYDPDNAESVNRLSQAENAMGQMRDFKDFKKKNGL